MENPLFHGTTPFNGLRMWTAPHVPSTCQRGHHIRIAHPLALVFIQSLRRCGIQVSPWDRYPMIEPVVYLWKSELIMSPLVRREMAGAMVQYDVT